MINVLLILGIITAVYGVIYGTFNYDLMGLFVFFTGTIMIIFGIFGSISVNEIIYNEYQLQSGEIVCCSTIGVSELTDLYNCLDNKTYYSQSNVIKLGVCEE